MAIHLPYSGNVMIAGHLRSKILLIIKCTRLICNILKSIATGTPVVYDVNIRHEPVE